MPSDIDKLFSATVQTLFSHLFFQHQIRQWPMISLMFDTGARRTIIVIWEPRLTDDIVLRAGISFLVILLRIVPGIFSSTLPFTSWLIAGLTLLSGCVSSLLY